MTYLLNIIKSKTWSEKKICDTHSHDESSICKMLLKQ